MKRLWLVLAIVAAFPAYSQEYPNREDLELWTSAALKVKLTKNWSLAYEQALRLHRNWGELKNTYSELGLDYKIDKHWSFGATYRFSQTTDKPYPIHHDHRLVIDAAYMEDYKIRADGIDEIEVELRLRYQTRYRDMFVSDDGLLPSQYLRSKLSFTVDIDRDFEPSFGTELYYRIQYDGSFFNTYRLFARLDWDLNSESKLGFTLIRETSFNVNRPGSANIFSISYSYKIKTGGGSKEDPEYHNIRNL